METVAEFFEELSGKIFRFFVLSAKRFWDINEDASIQYVESRHDAVFSHPELFELCKRAFGVPVILDVTDFADGKHKAAVLVRHSAVYWALIYRNIQLYVYTDKTRPEIEQLLQQLEQRTEA